MNLHAAQLLLIVLVAGLASQWLAARLRLPAIVVLIGGRTEDQAHSDRADRDPAADPPGAAQQGVSIAAEMGGHSQRASNLVQHEAGLLSVTVMGLVIGNMKLIELEALHRFGEQLTAVLLSVLFIIIPAQLQTTALALLDWRVALYVLALLFIVRPLTIALATAGAPKRGADKRLLGWIAPRVQFELLLLRIQPESTCG